MAFADRLKELRRERRLTQAALALAADMPKATVCNLEQGRHLPTWDSVQRLADALGTPTDAFRDQPTTEAKPTKRKKS